MQSDPSQDRSSSAAQPPSNEGASGSRNSGVLARGPHQNAKRPVKKPNQVCRFYGTKKGCRAGDQCPYRHIENTDNVGTVDETSADNPERTIETNETSAVLKNNEQSHLTLQQPRVRAVVSKPIPAAQQKNPREFQISQVIKRFSPTRNDGSNATILRLKLKPSDPDFPFDLDELQCALSVPITFPTNGRPSIRIENAEIPRGFQINVERGFDSLYSRSSEKTLLQLLNDLDRHLEQFLTSEKAQTIKIIANRKKIEPNSPVATPLAESSKPEPLDIPSPRHIIADWSPEQKSKAKSKRDVEVGQLEARMGRVPLFSILQDGISFNVPLQIPKPTRLPLPLRNLKDAILVVPKLYHLEPCRIKLKGVSGKEAENLEVAFRTRAVDHCDMTLMAHINYLTQNAHSMAMLSSENAVPVQVPHQVIIKDEFHTEQKDLQPSQDLSEGIVDEDRPHLRFMSQPPPEWSHRQITGDDSESESSEEIDSEEYSSDESLDTPSRAGGASLPVAAPSAILEKGILLSFPQLELHGIELLELRDMSLSVKCDRCKDVSDIKGIKPAGTTITSIRTESCKKCASPISISYRCEPMHANSIKAGYLDIEGCTIADLLPSCFVPTCLECSTVQPAPGVVAVRGESPLAVCRECHHRLNFKIPEVKFLRVSSNDPRLNLPLRSKKKKENLGITAGAQLPDRGRCKHYTKSYRWFRFSCCNRVYACDRCHDEKEEHANEHANRMICGWCSREQNYRPEDCSSCGRSVIRKTGGGFWEGGKGTRDKKKMSRKDPRKYKRIGGGAKGGEK